MNMLEFRKKSKIQNLTIPTTKETFDGQTEPPTPSPLQDQPVYKDQYRQNYRKANWLSRITLHYGYTLLSSVNNNGGKLDEEFLEEMELMEGELDLAVARFKANYLDYLKKLELQKKPPNH